MTLKAEYRNGYYVSEETKQIWDVELRLLKKLLDVCEENNLKIWANGGTLLGAIRERGFIPWDNDIDVEMPREDYDKLQAIAPKVFHSPFFFQSGYTDLSPSGFSRLRMDGTTATLRSAVFRRQHHGIPLDIFPLDVLPDNIEERNQYLYIVRKYKRHLFRFFDPQFSFTNWGNNLQSIKTIVLILLKGGFKRYYSEFDQYLKRYKHTAYKDVSPIAFKYDEKFIRKLDWYAETLFFPFEDMTVPVPSGYHNILETEFGADYMIPQKVPSGHGEYLYVSTTQSYKDIMPMLRRKCRREKRRIKL